MGGDGGCNSSSSTKNVMTTNNKITQLEVQLCKVKADKARWDTKMKMEVEEKQVSEEKVAVEAMRVVKEHAAAEMEEQQRSPMLDPVPIPISDTRQHNPIRHSTTCA